MAQDLATGGFETEVGGAAVAMARIRCVLVSTLTLCAILVLGAVVWLQVAARFDTARVHTEGETVRNAMGGMLSMGVPLDDFIGFDAVAARIFHANPGILAIVVRDRAGHVVLSSPSGSPIVADLPAPDIASVTGADASVLDRVGGNSRLTMPISNRFGPVGSLELVFERSLVHDLTRQAALAGLAAIALLAVGLVVHGLAIANPEFFQSRQDMVGAYLVASLLGLALTGSALVGLSAEKAEETAGAYAYSLGARLGEAVELGISPDDLSGLDAVVGEYRDSNSVIGYVALLEGNRITTATGLEGGDNHWELPSGYFDALYEVRPRRLYTPQYRVAVGIPWRIAMQELVDAAMLPLALAVLVLGLGTAAMIRIRVQERA